MHVDLGQGKLIQNAGKDGKRVGECFHFRSGVANKKRELKKVGSLWPQLKHCMNRSVLNVLCGDFTSKKSQIGRGERKKTLPGEW